MTEVQLYTPQQIAPTDPTGGRLVAWATAANAANQLAKALVTTDFVPAAFKDNVGNATAAILTGDEVGLSPLAALRALYVVHGTPAMYTRTMVALTLSAGHEVWTEKSTDTEVIVCGRRKGSENVDRSTWTVARARAAGYTNNKKYQTSPIEMLYAKAAAEVCRRIAADVLLGIPATVEETELDQPGETATAARRTATSAERKTIARRAPRQADEPPLDDEPTRVSGGDSGIQITHVEGTEGEDMGTIGGTEPAITRAQSSKLHALFNDFQVTNRVERLEVVSAIVARPVESSSDLTKDEAVVLIDTLDSLLGGVGEGEPRDYLLLTVSNQAEQGSDEQAGADDE